MAKQSLFHKMELYLFDRYEFKHNTVLNKIEMTDLTDKYSEYLGDYELNSLLAELHRNMIEVSKAMLMNLLFSGYTEQFDPFKEYFEALPVWNPDMPDYIKMLADTVTVPEEDRSTWETYLRRWLIATVGCSTKSNITNQTVLVFIGEQGVGKTRWTERLVPRKLSEYYFSGNVNPGDKDSSINLAECFIINLDELGNLNRGDLNSLKQLITQSSIRVRRPYGTIAEKMPRRASFVGSVNNPEFLRDDTGNRRYLCVEGLKINYAHGINMDLVYAQAYYLLNQGEKYWFDGEDIQDINKHNEKYKVQQVELEIIDQHFDVCENQDTPDMVMSITELQNYLVRHGENLGNLNLRKLGITMRSSKYQRTKKNGTWYYKFKNKELVQEEG